MPDWHHHTYYTISQIFPEIKVIPEEQVSLFASCWYPQQLFLFYTPKGLFPQNNYFFYWITRTSNVAYTASLWLHYTVYLLAISQWKCDNVKRSFMSLVNGKMVKINVKRQMRVWGLSSRRPELRRIETRARSNEYIWKLHEWKPILVEDNGTL